MKRAGNSEPKMQVVLRACLIVPAVLLTLVSPKTSHGYERIVVLYGAASPILKELGAGDRVVGVTRNDGVFSRALKVGSHLKPNIELIKALGPDLVVAGSKRAFPENLAGRIEADVFYYDPRSLEEILLKIEALGRLLGREDRAQALVRRLRDKVSSVAAPAKRPTVVYEISARSLRVAGQRSIITSIIEAAGGVNLVEVEKKHVLLSPEKVMDLSPDFYIYQVGPMNKNPEPPRERPYFRALTSKVVEVDEFEFARPGINAFEAVLDLNKIFRGEDQ